MGGWRGLVAGIPETTPIKQLPVNTGLAALALGGCISCGTGVRWHPHSACPHRQPLGQQGIPGPKADIDTPRDCQVPTQRCARAPPPPHLALRAPASGCEWCGPVPWPHPAGLRPHLHTPWNPSGCSCLLPAPAPGPQPHLSTPVPALPHPWLP